MLTTPRTGEKSGEQQCIRRQQLGQSVQAHIRGVADHRDQERRKKGRINAAYTIRPVAEKGCRYRFADARQGHYEPDKGGRDRRVELK